MDMLSGALRLFCAALAVSLAHWAVRPEILPVLASAAGTAAAMGLWAGALLVAAAGPVVLGPARGLVAVGGTALALRGAAQAAPWVTGPALPMEDAGALVAPLAMAAVGTALAVQAIGRRHAAPRELTPRGGAPRSRA